jgi:hypothetical protein
MQTKSSVRLRCQKRIKSQLKSSRTFHRIPYGHVQKITVRVQYGLEKTRVFNPAAQDMTDFLTATEIDARKS